MILMLNENSYNSFKDKYYRPVSECIKEINKLYNINISNAYKTEVGRALKACKWIKRKQIPWKGDYCTLYYIGSLKKFNHPNNAWDEEYDKDYCDLTSKLEKELKIKIDTNTNTVKTQPIHQSVQNNPNELFQDETNMEYCNQQLLNKYQFENKKRTVKITEAQLKNIINLLS